MHVDVFDNLCVIVIQMHATSCVVLSVNLSHDSRYDKALAAGCFVASAILHASETADSPTYPALGH